ncbi:hypothetical protein [Blastococcus sp. URHD0036]|uniref:hypothetical protein n=1 Tax=Blastococcus sp. URHD0036 TaxID=1380356 RepID=UPI000495882F|nr:hypothetical protein [Blastococcus sp. URHD0036]
MDLGPVHDRALPGADGDQLRRTLAFAGSWTSDDGQVSIEHTRGATGYSAARFTGCCRICARAGLTPRGGEPLADLVAAARFLAAHHHGEVD